MEQVNIRARESIFGGRRVKKLDNFLVLGISAIIAFPWLFNMVSPTHVQ